MVTFARFKTYKLLRVLSIKFFVKNYNFNGKKKENNLTSKVVFINFKDYIYHYT